MYTVRRGLDTTDQASNIAYRTLARVPDKIPLPDTHTHLLYLAARRLDQHETNKNKNNIIIQRNYIW